MASSDFWHDLAIECRALPGGNSFRGDWDYTANSGRPYQWRFAEGNKATHTRFEALARRAASEMPNPAYSDLLLSWLEALRKNSHQPGIMGDYTEQNTDGSDGPVHVVGSLRNLCEESAIYCDQLESDARQREFEEKQRNVPRNWSQFRQQYEAFKTLKEVISETPERIPEEFVRNTIARIHNIKPEEVTPQQINFEVAGLLSSTQRHIELIPSAARRESPPVAEEKHVYVGIESTREREKPEPVHDAVPRPITASRIDPTALRDSYLANFPDEKIKLRDLCWAAGQHYREWKRWLAGELKDGSTPDLAFRRVLTSGKRTHELSKKPRPKGWE
jgi:hypothetical protein